jgi:ABC-type polysaccharide/polyol phosphate export permease
VTVWFYLSPVIYGVSRVPASLERFMYLNPFAIIMPAYQAIFFGGVMPSAWALGAVFVSSLILLVLGLRLLSHAQHRIYRFL